MASRAVSKKQKTEGSVFVSHSLVDFLMVDELHSQRELFSFSPPPLPLFYFLALFLSAPFHSFFHSQAPTEETMYAQRPANCELSRLRFRSKVDACARVYFRPSFFKLALLPPPFFLNKIIALASPTFPSHSNLAAINS